MIHHSNVTCGDCGEQHTPGNPFDCIECLISQRDSARSELADLIAQREADDEHEAQRG